MRPKTPLTVIMSGISGAGYAIDVLRNELGPLKTIEVIMSIASDTAAGEPWKELPPPSTDEEALSRRQLQGAVLLERNLRKVVDDEKAREMTAEVVHRSSIDFLSLTIPKLKKARFLAKDEDAKNKYLEKIKNKFFNAESDMEPIEDRELRMTVRRCLFVELLEAIGEKDMAGMFCAGDLSYFQENQREVRLERTMTIAGGAECCDFRFFWEEK